MSTIRNSNPYQGVTWPPRIEVVSCTHMHCVSNAQLHQYLAEGLELAALSNYYPSAPYYPLRTMRQNSLIHRQYGYIYQGKWHHETIDFAAQIAKWSAELPAEVRAKLPLAEGDLLFRDLPDTLLEIPNAEHHWFSDAGIWLHLTAPGAQLASGTFDLKRQFLLAEHGYRHGIGLPWQTAFGELLNSLLIPDGGGIVIAHPTWSHLPLEFLETMLDFDERVLGIEVYNHNSELDYSDFSDSLWDAILSTGRQCFGFFVQDHPMPGQAWQGKIILLPEERTAESCLKALRQGRFYGAIRGSGLRFTALEFDGTTLHAACNRPANFMLIAKTGVVGDIVSGTEFTYHIPPDQRKKLVFLRLTAAAPTEHEKIYSQPFMLEDKITQTDA